MRREVIKCADIYLFGVVKISADCKEGLNNPEQWSKLKHSANNCKNLPNLANKMMGPKLVITTEESVLAWAVILPKSWFNA